MARRRRQGRHVVDHARHGELDDAALSKLCAELAAARAAGHEVVLVCSGAIAAGLPALGLDTRPDRHRHAAGRRRGRPAPPDGAHRRDPRPARRSSPARCCSRRTTSASHAVPARARDAAPAARSRRGAGRQRERHRRRRRDPLRRQRPPRRARVAPGAAPTCSCCSPTPPGSSPPIPRLDAERVAHRGDRRGRRRARGGGRRHRHRPGERRHGEQARGGEDRGVVGCARGDRGRRRARRRASTRSRARRSAPWSVRGRQRLPSRKLWIAFARGAAGGRRRRRRPARARAPRPLAAPRGRARGGGRLRRRRRGRGRRRGRARRSPRASSGTRRHRCRAVAGRRTADLAEGCRTRSSTATTSWSCPEHRGFARASRARERSVRHSACNHVRASGWCSVALRPCLPSQSPELVAGRRGEGPRARASTAGEERERR